MTQMRYIKEQSTDGKIAFVPVPIHETKSDNVTWHYLNVLEFMQKAKQATPAIPFVPGRDVRELRAKLILEEALETVAALGFDVCLGPDRALVEMACLSFADGETPNLEEIIDGCCDIKVVTTGTLIACGVPDEPFQRAVDQNNLDKFGPGHSWREDGKLIKPSGHKPPDIAGILIGITPGASVAGADPQ